MGWSLEHRSLQESQFIDSYFLAIGKALYLATEFEGKCLYILQLLTILQIYKRTKDASLSLSQTVKSRFLNKTITGLSKSSLVKKKHLDVLHQAREARNYIAHESGKIGPLFSVTPKEVRGYLKRLQGSIDDLANGDNLVSTWIYEIENKEPAPSFQRLYPKMIRRWIFGKDDCT